MSRPRPVLTKASISGLIVSLAGVLSWLGYVGPAADLSKLADTIGAVVVGAVPLLSHLLPALSAQKEVTPVVQPQDHDGTPLVRVAPASSSEDPETVEPMSSEPAS